VLEFTENLAASLCGGDNAADLGRPSPRFGRRRWLRLLRQSAEL